MIKKEVEIELTPQDLAVEFWQMDPIQQADFFNTLGDIFKINGNKGYTQMNCISFKECLCPYGAELINNLATAIEEYGR